MMHKSFFFSSRTEEFVTTSGVLASHSHCPYLISIWLWETGRGKRRRATYTESSIITPNREVEM